jgi:hypothetical protein
MTVKENFSENNIFIIFKVLTKYFFQLTLTICCQSRENFRKNLISLVITVRKILK